MIDEAQRHRRKLLAWILLALAAAMLVVLLFGRVLLDQLLLGTLSNSYALITALLLIFLALAGTGAYLLTTVRNR